MKDTISRWKLGKNLHERDIAPLIRCFRQADRDPRRPLVKIRGRIIQRPKLNAYLKRKRKSEEDILAAPDANRSIPDHITLEYQRPETPSTDAHSQRQGLGVSPETLTTPSCAATYAGTRSNESTRLPTPEFSHGPPAEQRPSMDPLTEQQLLPSNLQVSQDRNVVGNGKLVTSNHTPAELPGQLEHPVGANISSMLDTFGSYNNMIDQLLRPDSPAASTPNQCNVFKLLSGLTRVPNHERLIQDLDRQCRSFNGPTADNHSYHNGKEMSQEFLLHFFGACTLWRQGAQEATVASSFRLASDLLTAMVSNCHPDTLATLNVMLPIVEALGQNDLAADFLTHLLMFSQQHLINNPIAATADFLVRVAKRQLRLVDKDIRSLEALHRRLSYHFGPQSSSALVGMYNVAWTCAKVEEHREKALHILDDLIPAVTEILGESHCLAIACMTTKARVLSYIRSVEDSVSVMRQALRMIDSRYPKFHPYRLEALYRLVLFLIDAHHCEEAERILTEVVEQRTLVFGHTNKLTMRSLKLLQDRSRWENTSN